MEVVEKISPVFAGINLEDISSPRCFDIERRLCERLDIPVFHDDQHGTAVVGLAALLNALKITDRKMDEVKIVFNGAGASAISVTKLLIPGRAQNITVCDTTGVVYQGPRQGHEPHQGRTGGHHQPGPAAGEPGRCLAGRRGLHRAFRPNMLTQDMVRSMAADPIVFAMANPDPEIHPRRQSGRGPGGGHGAVGFPQPGEQLPGVPRIFRGALDIRARGINDAMNIAAAHAIADLVGDRLSPAISCRKPWISGCPPAVAEAVARAAMETGTARIQIEPERVARHTRNSSTTSGCLSCNNRG